MSRRPATQWSAGPVQLACDAVIVAAAFALVEPDRVIYSIVSAVMVNLVLLWNHRPDAQSLSHVKTAFVARR
jgi:uncharacterized membrane-anchored protein YitT (DUF2179 family)